MTIFKFDKNGRKFSKQAENTVGKGEIARYEQFLRLTQYFQKTCTADTKKPGLVWERVKDIDTYYTTKICPLKNALSEINFDKSQTNLFDKGYILYQTTKEF